MPILGGGYRLGGGLLLGGGAGGGGGIGGGGGPPPDNPGTIQVTLDEKHPTFIGVVLQYIDENGDTIWGEPTVMTYDFDLIANIWTITTRYDGIGTVFVNLIGDEDTVSMVATVGINAIPSDPVPGAVDLTIVGNNGSASSSKGAKYGDYVYVKARGINSDGAYGPISTNFVVRGDAPKHPPKVHATAIRTSTDVDITIEVDDATLSVTSIQFKRRLGNGSLDSVWQETWTGDFSYTIGVNNYLKRFVTITQEDGLDGEFHWQVNYTNENGSIETIGDTIYLSNLSELDKKLIISGPRFAGGNGLDWSFNYLQSSDGTGATTAHGIAELGDLPMGTQVQRIDFFGSRPGTGTLEVEFIKIDIANTTNAFTSISGSHDFPTSTIDATVSVTGINEDISDNYTYYIRIDIQNDAFIGGVNTFFNGAVIYYFAPSYEFTR